MNLAEYARSQAKRPDYIGSVARAVIDELGCVGRTERSVERELEQIARSPYPPPGFCAFWDGWRTLSHPPGPRQRLTAR